MEWPLIQGGVVILLVTSCYGTGTGFHWKSHWAQVQTVTLYPVRHDHYMIVKVHSYVKVVLLIPSTVL